MKRWREFRGSETIRLSVLHNLTVLRNTSSSDAVIRRVNAFLTANRAPSPGIVA